MHHPPHRLPLVAALALSACAPSAGLPAEAPATEVWIPHPPPIARDPVAPAADPGPEEAPRREIARREGRQPNHFWFLHIDETSERRDWVKIDPETWEERYPSGAVTRFHVVGRLDDGSRAGVLVRREPDESMDVLIPDMVAGAWIQFRVAPGGDWHPLGQAHLIE